MAALPEGTITLEICIASVEDALAAQTGGADRVELNAALALGGLTPSLGMLLEVKQTIALPVMVMIRPRPGGFCYSAREFLVMQRDLDLAIANGADGAAFGILTAEGRVDVQRCRELLDQMGDREAVFHRAFDVTPDPSAALEQLIDLGVRRIMTSGQQATALQGAARITDLIRHSADRIEILPASGIHPGTVAAVVEQTGCTQVHASVRRIKKDLSTAGRPQIRFTARQIPPGNEHEVTDPDAVAAMCKVLGKKWKEGD
jgi:copper homeostasis protein